MVESGRQLIAIGAVEPSAHAVRTSMGSAGTRYAKKSADQAAVVVAFLLTSVRC
jgi:hypothetical protein